MASTHVLVTGKMVAGNIDLRIDTRLAELLDWRRETASELPLPADLIIWLEDRGYVVDMITGCTSRLEPLQELIDEAAELADYQEWIADQDYHRSGNW
jgi:hypothetical protein